MGASGSLVLKRKTRGGKKEVCFRFRLLVLKRKKEGGGGKEYRRDRLLGTSELPIALVMEAVSTIHNHALNESRRIQ